MTQVITILAIIIGVWVLIVNNVNFVSGIMVTECTEPGQRIADSDNTTIYYFCGVQFENGSWYVEPMSCPSDAYFNTTYSDCVQVDPTSTTTTTTTTTTTPTTTTSVTTTSRPPTTTSAGYICRSSGYFPDPYVKCTRYYQCIIVGGIWYYYIYNCPSGTYYDMTIQLCKAGTCPY